MYFNQSPYCLKAGTLNSDNFYQNLDKLTDYIIAVGSDDLRDLIFRLKPYYVKEEKDTGILLDILIFGILWDEYSNFRVRRLTLKSGVIRFLFRLRKYKKIKNFVDTIRGKLTGYWLTQAPENKYSNTDEQLRAFRKYLLAICEFEEEIERIDRFCMFLLSVTHENAGYYIERTQSFTRSFKTDARLILGKYTQSVEGFLKNHKPGYKGREDYFFCGRSEPEYFLNMAGAAIMNKDLRDEFDQAPDKVVLLPTCMAGSTACKAITMNGGMECRHCTPGCHISVITREAEKEGIRAMLIRHSSDFSEFLKPWANQKQTALIGVACVLNLLKGGFEMKRLNIPSQCVFLDYCGCKKHWQTGMATNINIGRLLTIAGKASSASNQVAQPVA